MKRLILYDLDGTLVDTGQDITGAVNHMLRELSLPPMSRSEVLGTVGQGIPRLVERCLPANDPQQVARGVQAYCDYYAAHLLDSSALYPSAQALLDYFKARKQAVVTNKPNPYSRQILAGLGVADYFLEIIAGDTDYPGKPDPASVRALMDRCGVAPHETLLIGDSRVDVETGRNAGVLTVIVAQGFSDEAELSDAAPDLLVRGLEEVLALAQRRGW